MITTVAEVAAHVDQRIADTFLAENTAGQAHRDPTELTMSGLGGCTRAAAYAVAGTPASDVHPPEQARAAVLGGWMHDKLFTRMAALGGGLVERPVTLTAGGITIRGTLDFAELRRLGCPVNLVWEGKSVNSWRMQGVLRYESAFNAHWLQAVGYGWGLYQGGEDVDFVTWLYLHRERGEVSRYVTPFNKFATNAVETRLREIAYWAENPDQAPREIATIGGRHREYATLRGPGLSLACDHCPWLSRCWPGAVAGEVGAQTVLAEFPRGVEKALEIYEAGRVKVSDGDSDKAFAAAILAKTAHGTYGPFAYSHGKASEREDVDTMRARLAELGELTEDLAELLGDADLPPLLRARLDRLAALGRPIPKKKTAPPISVKRAAQSTEA